MPSLVEQFTQRGAIRPPSWMADNVVYETVMGSTAYGVATNDSDYDTVGVCIPPKEIVFPHLAGVIEGFGRQRQNFICYQKHHLRMDNREYDINTYNIVAYFNLCLENNPNIIDTLFTSQECVLHSTKVGNMIRDKRHIFLHKGCWHRFKGYAYNQLHKMKTKAPEEGSKRAEVIAKFGYDVKYAYHLVRLLDEVEQLLTTGDLDLRRNSPQLKAIRRGEVTEEDIVAWAAAKEHALERAYETSDLPYGPNEKAIKNLLLACLEEHWGSIEGCIALADDAVVALAEIQEIIDTYRRRQDMLNRKPDA